jgi:quercetin dioxygenase-like cupin family protein
MSKVPLRLLGSAVLVVAATSLPIERALAQSEPPGFLQTLSSDVKWMPNAAVRPGAQMAVVLGDPRGADPYVIRIKLPANFQIQPHTHPEGRTYTVLQGTWKLGFGSTFDAAKMKEYPAGSVYRLPANVPHFQMSGSSETIVQINARGPTSTDYVNPADDPRKR